MLGQISPAAGTVFRNRKPADGSRFRIDSDLPGLYQRKNVLTALTALDVLNGRTGGLSISREQVFSGNCDGGPDDRADGTLAQLEANARWLCAIPVTMKPELREVAAQLAAQHYRKLLMVVGLRRGQGLVERYCRRCYLKERLLFFFLGGDPARARRKNWRGARGSVRIARGNASSVSEALRLARSQPARKI